LACEPYLAVAELTGSAARSRIVLAAPIALSEIESRLAGRIESSDEIVFDPASAALRGRSVRRLGAIALADRPTKITPNEDTARRLATGQAAAAMARPRDVPAPRGRRRVAGFV
jgi:ATP-dependent helicase HrpB